MENSFLAHPLKPPPRRILFSEGCAPSVLALRLPEQDWDQKGGTLLKQKKAPSNGGGREPVMLPNARDVGFLVQRGIAALYELSENAADWVFRNRTYHSNVPVWYSLTRPSKKFTSIMLPWVNSSIQGNGFVLFHCFSIPKLIKRTSPTNSRY